MSWQERFSSKMNRSSWKTAHNDYHPHADNMDELQLHLMSHHQDDFIGDLDDHEHFHSDPSDYLLYTKHMGFPVKNHDPDHYHSEDYRHVEIPNELPKSFAFNKLADPGSLRGEGISGMIDPDEEVVGPQDLDSNATEVDKFPKSVGVFKNSSKISSWKTANDAGGSQFGNPINENANRMQSVEAPGLEIRTPLDTGKRNYSEQRADANPLTLRSWFTGDDVNGPWPHTKNLSGPLDFEPTDNQNEDSTGPVLSSFQERYAHMEGINHPWPENHNDAKEHMISHHEPVIQGAMEHFGDNREQAISRIRRVGLFTSRYNGKQFSPLDAHIFLHKHPTARVKHPPTHEHDNDDLGVEIPENIETIAPTYITSSWHQSNVKVFDTHPDEESPDSLLNPADDLKNGRPRSTDLPSQNAQFIPGMLVDHDPMGGSDFGST